MIKIKQPKTNEFITTIMTLAGQEFEIDLMPVTEKERLDIFRKFRKRKQIPNPLTREMNLVDYIDVDDPKFQEEADNFLCRIIGDFRGIGDADGKPLDGTLKENKLLLGSVRVGDFEEIPIIDDSGQTAVIRQPRERYFRALIIDKAVELSKPIVEVERKNS